MSNIKFIKDEGNECYYAMLNNERIATINKWLNDNWKTIYVIEELYNDPYTKSISYFKYLNDVKIFIRANVNRFIKLKESKTHKVGDDIVFSYMNQRCHAEVVDKLSDDINPKRKIGIIDDYQIYSTFEHNYTAYGFVAIKL